MKKVAARPKFTQIPALNGWGMMIIIVFSVICIGIGIGTWLGKKSLNSNNQSLLFPMLLNQLNDATIVQVQNENETLIFTRLGDAWFLNNYAGLPVDANRLREQLLNLSRIKIIEPKTRDPSLYERLNVADPGAKIGAAKSITILDRNKKILAGLLIGKPDTVISGRLSRNFFARRIMDNQAWLVQGMVSFPIQAKSWLDHDFFHIEPRRLQSLSWGTGMEVQRASPFEEAIDNPWTMLEFLRFTDVAPKEKVLNQASMINTFKAKTFDGMIIELKAYKPAAGRLLWITLEALWHPAPGIDAWKLTKEKDSLASAALRSSAHVKAEVEILTRMSKEWAFQIPEASQIKFFPVTERTDDASGQ